MDVIAAGFIASIVLLLTIAPQSWLGRADSLTAAIAMIAVWVAWHGWTWPVKQPILWQDVLLVFGWWRLLAWGIGNTRSSGWIPGGKMWHSLLALVLCPLLCLPTIVRKARLSFEYTGLVFFHAEIFGLGYYLLPNVSTSTLVAWTSAFSGLGVRLFFQTNQYWSEYCNKRVAMFLSYFFWPFTAALNILYIALLSLAQLLNYWWVILMGTIAGMYFSHAAMGAALAAGIVLLPQLLGVTVYSLLPTGFGNAGYGNTLGGNLTEDNLHIRGFDNTFDTGFSAGSVMFDINPANGQPMMGGFGGADIYGNTYGTNFNDP